MEITGYKDKHEYVSESGVKSTVYLMDCMELMSQLSENQIGLAVVDPPYGIGEADGRCRTRKKHNNKVKHTKKDWDIERPSAEYWAGLRRVSKNQIVWGANYFTEHLPPSMGWIFWNKQIGGDFSDGELAYTSFDRALKMVTKWSGNNGVARIHPTQKPIALYDWIFHNYAKPTDSILDTHLGSQSSRIAAHKNSLEFIGCELDSDYFYQGCKRFDNHVRQLTIF
jgi:site-specific DNA-methyltransferase (adenine-specific)